MSLLLTAHEVQQLQRSFYWDLIHTLSANWEIGEVTIPSGAFITECGQCLMWRSRWRQRRLSNQSFCYWNKKFVIGFYISLIAFFFTASAVSAQYGDCAVLKPSLLELTKM